MRDISDVVRRLVEQYGTTDPFELADYLEINVKYKELPRSVDGFYVRIPPDRYIVIKSGFDTEWNRMICAHELGHDCMHEGLGYYFLSRQTFFRVDKYEREADAFALSLLTWGEVPEEGETKHNFFTRLGIIDRFQE